MNWAFHIKDDKGLKTIVKAPKPKIQVNETEFYSAVGAVAAAVLKQIGAKTTLKVMGSDTKGAG